MTSIRYGSMLRAGTVARCFFAFATLLFTATAWSAPYIYSGKRSAGVVEVRDARSHRLHDIIDVGGAPFYVTLNSDRTRLYVLDDQQNRLLIIDAVSGRTLREVAIAGSPKQVLVPDDDAKIVVSYWSGMLALTDSFALVDTATGTMIHNFSVIADVAAISPNGKTLFVAQRDPCQLLAFDTETFAIRGSAALPGCNLGRGLKVSPDGLTVVLGIDSFIDSITSYRADTLEPLLTIPILDGGVSLFAFSDDSRILYSTDYLGRLNIVDLAIGQAITSFPTCPSPTAISLTPDQRFVYVMCEYFPSGIAIIDTRTNALVSVSTTDYLASASDDFIGAPPAPIYVANASTASVSTVDPLDLQVSPFATVDEAPASLLVSRDGARLYVANSGAGSVSVVPLLSPEPVATIAVGAGPAEMALSPNGDRLYVSHPDGHIVSAVDTQTRSVVSNLSFGALDRPRALALSPDGSRLYVTLSGYFYVDIIDTSSLLLIDSIYIGEGADAIVMSPDGEALYVATGLNEVIRIDTASHQISATWVAGISPSDTIGALALSPDGYRLYAAIQNQPVVNEINTRSGALMASIPLHDLPTAIQSTVEGRYLYVAMSASNSVARIDTAHNTVTHVLAGFSSPSAIAPYAEARTNLIFRSGFDG